MSEDKTPKTTLTRRGFLKATGAVAGAAALASGATVAALAIDDGQSGANDEQVYNCVCQINCPAQACGMKVHVRDGKVVNVRAKTDVEIPEDFTQYEYDRRPCLKGRSHSNWIYNPNRVLYPLRRVEGTERGAGQWERITWEEALKEIGEKFNAYREEFGPTSIGMPYLTGCSGVVQGVNGSWYRFANAAQATRFDYALDYGYATGENRVTGTMFGANSSFFDIVNSKALFIWGANWTDSLMQSWHYVMKAKRNGVKIICIDPHYSGSAAKSDMYVPINAGTDSALIMAMMNYMIKSDLCNIDFLLANTTAPGLVRQDNGMYLRHNDVFEASEQGAGAGVDGIDQSQLSPAPGAVATVRPLVDDPILVWDEETGAVADLESAKKPALSGSFEVNGIKVDTSYDLLKNSLEGYSLEWASEITGIAPETIAELAEIYADGPCCIGTGYGFDRYDNADEVGHAILTMGALAGNIGVIGGGFGLMGTLKGTMLYMDVAFIMPAGPEKMATSIPWTCLPGIMETGMYGDKPYTIKAIFNIAANTFGNHAQQKYFLEEVLPKIEFVVTSESRMTDTARYSDIVLPAAHWWEVDDISALTWLQINEKAVEPRGEAKSNYELYGLVAEQIGLGEFFQEEIPDICARIIESNPGLAAQGITYEMLKEKGSICNIHPQFYDGNAFRNFVYKTKSGRMEFYCESPVPRFDYGQGIDVDRYRLPRYSECAEINPGNPLREKYPVVVLQEHSKWRAHTAFGDHAWLKELDPEPVVRLSPEDAESRNIETGDVVRVFNDRGSVTLKAIIDNSYPQGTCNIPKGWERWQSIDGCYQELTSNRINPVSFSQSFNDTLAEIEKVS